MTTQGYLDLIYERAAEGDADPAADLIEDGLDRLLCVGAFAICDDMLAHVEVERLPSCLLRSFLTSTAPVRSRLPSRPALYRRIQKRLNELRGPEMTRRLIGALA